MAQASLGIDLPPVSPRRPPVGAGRRRRRGVALAASVTVAFVAGGALLALRGSSHKSRPAGPPCQATNGTATYAFDLAQGTNATTIAGVGKRLGLADHAITIALAAALQESGLHNLDHGDLDSLGLFQQRPSQGWGTSAQIMTPTYAAAAFFNRLAQVPGWTTLAVSDAAQAVQRSAVPDAYAQWEPQARVLAEALTGEVPAGFACQLHATRATAAEAAAISSAMASELGPTDLSANFAVPRGWTVASWLIGHAQALHVASVSYQGQRWSASSGTWVPHQPAKAQIVINQT